MSEGIRVTKRRTRIDAGSGFLVPTSGLIPNRETIKNPLDPESRTSFCVVKIGQEFHMEFMQYAGEDDAGDEVWISSYGDHEHEVVEVYQPIHEDVEDEDIIGATYAHDTGTHWKFAHCSPDEQIDFAADVENYVRAEMQDAINRAQTALILATTALGKTDARHKVDALGEFARAAGSNAHHRVVTATLGYWHRNPHKDHRRELAVLAMEAVLATWAELGTADTDEGRTITAQRAHVLSEVNEVLKRLKKNHSIEWRADRQKRLNDAEAAKGTDPVDGYEYCYTRAVFPAVITGEANLPSPTWNFDALRNGNSLRGNYVYYDAEPPVTRYIAHIIRFKRPIPEGTLPGADIGSVAWEQEAAYTKDD